MPAKSEKQATAARIAMAVKKGKVKAKPGSASEKMAKGMTKKQLKHFTKEDICVLKSSIIIETDIGLIDIPEGSRIKVH
jgi:hypothetical protein